MSGEISVDRYPGNNGKLFRSLQGIIYISSKNVISALGHDAKNVGIISPFNSDGIKALVEEGVKIDDSLARASEYMGGLSGHRFQSIDGEIICIRKEPLVLVTPDLVRQPVSLSKRVLDYIIKNHRQEKFNLGLLPLKLKSVITLRLKLRDKQSELEKIRIGNETLMIYLTHQHINKIHANELIYSQRAAQLENDHSHATEKLKNTADKMEAEMLAEIGKLEISILKSS